RTGSGRSASRTHRARPGRAILPRKPSRPRGDRQPPAARIDSRGLSGLRLAPLATGVSTNGGGDGMLRARPSRLADHAWMIAAGVLASVAAGWWLRRRRRSTLALSADLAGLEERVVDALLADPVLSQRPIEVGALSDGIVELTGTVRTEHEADRAVHVADPELTEREWYGMRVGTGRRRQSAGTDADRPDDRVDLVSRALGVDRAIEQTSEGISKLAPGVEGHTTAPAAPIDRGLVATAT